MSQTPHKHPGSDGPWYSWIRRIEINTLDITQIRNIIWSLPESPLLLWITLTKNNWGERRVYFISHSYVTVHHCRKAREAETTGECHSLAHLLSVSCSAGFLMHPRTTCLGDVPPKVSRALLHQWLMKTDSPSQIHPQASYIWKIPPLKFISLVTLSCVKLTVKTDWQFPPEPEL